MLLMTSGCRANSGGAVTTLVAGTIAVSVTSSTSLTVTQTVAPSGGNGSVTVVIYRHTATFTPPGTGTNVGTSFPEVDTGLTTNTQYFYEAIWTDSLGQTAHSNEVSATPVASSLLLDVRWQTGTVDDGSNDAATSNILRDSGNATKAGDAISGHNCSGGIGWWGRLAVVAPNSSYLGGSNYPYTSNIFLLKAHRSACGHCVFSSTFSVPSGGEFWGLTYDMIMVGTGQYRGDHPHCLHPFSGGGHILEGVHAGWDRMSDYSNATAVPNFAITCPGFTGTASFQPKTGILGSKITTTGGVWYRHQIIMAWDNSTQYRFIKRILRLPADGGAELCGPEDWFQRDNGGANLKDWYDASSSNRSTRSASTLDNTDITDITFGNGQAENDNESTPLYCGIAGVQAALVTSASDWLAGITS